MQVPAEFEYARAGSVAEAVELLTAHGPDARLVAGGHSLLPMMKLRLAAPEWLVDINDVPEMRGITREGDVVRVGAMTRHAELLDSELLGELFPVLREAERVIADPAVRNRGTIGGSLCQCDPAEDMTTVCEVLRAQVVVVGPRGTRTMAARDVHAGPYESTLSFDEVLTEVRFPVRARAGSAYEKVERRTGDWAVAAAGAAVTLDEQGRAEDVAIGLTALGVHGGITRAEEVLRAQVPTDDLVREAARVTAEEARPSADQRGPVDYKRHLAGELTRRVLLRAVERATAAAQQEG